VSHSDLPTVIAWEAARQIIVVTEARPRLTTAMLTKKIRHYAGNHHAEHVSNIYLEVVAIQPRGCRDLRSWLRRFTGVNSG